MKIKRIEVFQVYYKLLDQKYSWSRGNSVESFISNIIKITTDEGISGFGEVCPLGSAYMAAFAKGVPAGVAEIGRKLIGADPLQINEVYARMDAALLGHNYIKSPIDIACWDILGKVSGQPVCTLMGGKIADEIHLYRAMPQKSPELMSKDVLKYRSKGYRKFQLKVGGRADDDIKRIKAVAKVLKDGDVLIADANTGWIAKDALRVVNAVKDYDVYIEQPCLTLDECLVVREHTDLPMVLDEIITGVEPFLKAYERHAMDVINVKISRVGGLTKAKQIRDLCESLGIAMTLEDSWGGDITTAAIAHLAGSTNPSFHFSSTDFNSYNDLRIAPDAPIGKKGKLSVPSKHGLGINVKEKLLGKPVVTVQ